MLQEKDMIADAINTTKASISCYNAAIVECANQQLRGTLQQLRNEAEQFQYQLFQIAQQKDIIIQLQQQKQTISNKLKVALAVLK